MSAVRSVPLVPAPCEVPHFAPVRVRGGRYRLGRLVRHRRRALALGLAVTAAAIVAAGPRQPAGPPPDVGRVRGHPVADPVRARPTVEMVTAPVRIADAATVRLLRPGDRVDVIAAEESPTGTDARVVARRARVTQVPQAPTAQESAAEGGALVVLSVPRTTASRLAGAGVTARLAVTLW
ncbi:RcpC/CpaB family pilus assembly protein [Streptomyces sp. ME02-8801-2C]|nr:RcpC/CpaB family pilus assembly protein [Streptomyces sp. ME02-8801-2C]MDX3455805.1 RcpC/CpaB family pilus assembly protein [Streptomyces sp. ME02-8801-2C]